MNAVKYDFYDMRENDADADNAAYASMVVLGVELKRNEQGAVSMFLFLAWDYLIILNKIK